MKLILASQSPYRAELLGKLQLAFSQHPSHIDEYCIAGESPKDRALRLSEAKARAVADQLAERPIDNEQSLIIGSDQVAALGTTILNKPGGFEQAYQQLAHSQGQIVQFYTGCCVLNAASGASYCSVDEITVKFRTLSEPEITRYLQIEQPYDCAGSFKAEGLGISLFEYIHCDDPNALVGLPLISLCKLLRQHNFDPLANTEISEG